MIDVQQRTLPDAALWLFYASAAVRLVTFWVPASVVAGAVWSAQDGGFIQAVALSAGVLFLAFLRALWLPWLTWRSYAWQRRPHDLVVSEGVWFRDTTAIPLLRIQHVDLRQGVFERLLSLSTLYVYTAAGAGADAVIPGLPLADAEALRDDLVHTVAVSGEAEPAVVGHDDPTEEMSLGIDGV